MKRIDLVAQALRQRGRATAAELADALSLGRANVSGDLNRLCEMGAAEKSGGKPVYYTAKTPAAAPNPFDAFLEANPSLAHCGEQAKTAVLYPPNGMNILLLGETGVGKTMFARLVFDYAKAMGRVTADALVAFNCADYANTPQLLVSALFGVTKGAYTGADADRRGLIEAADGGALFLDEVHRLPPEGQEALFTFIDRGVYRRVGEAAPERAAKALILCATTEKPESALLQTFLRRIPTVIHIPALSERTLDERAQLVTDFLLGESARIGMPVNLTANSLRALLGYPCAGNVGRLEHDIRLLCAKAYADYVSGASPDVSFSSYALPAHIRDGLFAERDRRQIWARVAGVRKRYVTFDARAGAPNDLSWDSHADVYAVIRRRVADMRRVGAGDERVRRMLSEILDDYYERQRAACSADTERLVGPEILCTVDRLMENARRALGYAPPRALRCGIALHVREAVKRARAGKAACLPEPDAGGADARLAAFAAAGAALIEHDFNVRLSTDEPRFLALFFGERPARPPKRHVAVVAVAHGGGVATGMADTANRLVGAGCAKGFDAPLDEPPSYAYERVKEYIQAVGATEAIILADMGSLGGFARALSRELHIRAARFMPASTLHVLEAARSAALGCGLDDVLEAVKSLDALTPGRTDCGGLPAGRERLYVLAVCAVDEGGAQLIRNHLRAHLRMADGLCEVIPLAADAFAAAVPALKGRVVCVASPFRTPLDIPHFEPSRVFDGSALAEIQSLIDTEAAIVRVEQALSPMLRDLGGASLSHDIREMMGYVQRSLRLSLGGDLFVGLFCHIGCLMDKLTRGEPAAAFHAKETIRQRYPNELAAVAKGCGRLGAKYGVRFPDEELCRITALFARENLLELG